MAAPLEDFDILKTPEDKVEAILTFMKECLSQEGAPKFRDFWEVRDAFHPPFKECTKPRFKAEKWREFAALTVEARRLKEILDGESRFALQEIDRALDGIAKEASLAAPSEEGVALCEVLKERVHGLRWELRYLRMRQRQKEPLFKKMEEMDKELRTQKNACIEKMSACFLEEVKALAEVCQPTREDIQHLQQKGKALLLTHKVLYETGHLLRVLWHKTAGQDKKRMKSTPLQDELLGEDNLYRSMQKIPQDKKLWESLAAKVKAKLEGFRRSAGESNADFEKALHYRRLIERGKALYEKIEQERRLDEE